MRGVKVIRHYVIAENFNPFLQYQHKGSGDDVEDVEVTQEQIKSVRDDSEQYKALMALPGTIIDERCNMISINNNTYDSLDFMFNYIHYNAFLANRAGTNVVSSPIPFITECNQELRKYIDYGFIPVIFLPIQEINKWKAHLEFRLQTLNLPYISLATQSFLQTKRFKYLDIWAHRLDIHKKILPDVPPEKIRMEQAVRAIFKI